MSLAQDASAVGRNINIEDDGIWKLTWKVIWSETDCKQFNVRVADLLLHHDVT